MSMVHPRDFAVNMISAELVRQRTMTLTELLEKQTFHHDSGPLNRFEHDPQFIARLNKTIQRCPVCNTWRYPNDHIKHVCSS